MKIIESIKYDGWINTWSNVKGFVKKRVWGESITVLLQINLKDFSFEEENQEVPGVILRDFDRDHDVLPNIDEEKLDIWLARGDQCRVALCGSEVVGYAFIHLNEYYVDGVGHINLEKEGSFWIGPTFVKKEFRGIGINKLLIESLINKFGRDKSFGMTSANINNVASLKSFIRNGYRIIDVFYCRYSFGRQYIDRLMVDA